MALRALAGEHRPPHAIARVATLLLDDIQECGARAVAGPLLLERLVDDMKQMKRPAVGV
jgi:hypothetical protein